MEKQKTLLVSACLAGECCRYDGGHNGLEQIALLVQEGKAVPVCPERAGGLPCPRTPCEQQAGRVVGSDGIDYTNAFAAGVAQCLGDIPDTVCGAILKERSPSCGVHEIYDGTFTRTRIPGQGLFAKALTEQGIPVWSEDDFLQNKIPSGALA